MRRLGLGLGSTPRRKQLAAYVAIIEAWKPDVIHIHGTERDYGLVYTRGFTNVPTMVSIQGLIQICQKKLFGELQKAEIIGRLSSIVPFWRKEILRTYRHFKVHANTEKEILRKVDMVAGRTAWDKAWAITCNPNGQYRHVDEIMRPDFYASAPWDIAQCNPNQIFTTSGCQPLKGLHILIEAVSFLKKVIPTIKLKVASHGFGAKVRTAYGRYIKRLVQRYELMENVAFIGWLDANELAQHIRQSNCFVTPSFIENGCNALQEAMLVGIPCIASHAGGLTTTLEPPNSGLTFPAGDAAMLAMCIRTVFKDQQRAIEMGQNAYQIARQRHDPAKVVQQNMDCYDQLISMQTAN